MKTAKLIIDGKEIEIQINEEQLKQFCPQKKKTGYEKATKENPIFFFDLGTGYVTNNHDLGVESGSDNNAYIAANYYTSEIVAKNNARADRLMRQLRRFAVERREEPIDWKETSQHKFYIYYTNKYGISIGDVVALYDFGAIYFDTKEAAHLAIDAFRDELLWYFKEYKDSL